MDEVITFLHHAMLLCGPLFVAAIIAKVIMISSQRGFDVPAIASSFFRLYKGWEKRRAKKQSRRNFMRWNNRINYFLYTYVALFFVLLLVYLDDIFKYNA